jgi:hypothetical protein
MQEKDSQHHEDRHGPNHHSHDDHAGAHDHSNHPDHHHHEHEHHHHTHGEDHPRTKKEQASFTDPVCGMAVSPESAAGSFS